MDTNNTLLAHLMPWLHRPIEDRGTDALAFILSKSETCLKVLNEFLETDESNPEPVERVCTQLAVDAKSRPDLIGFDSGGRKNLIVESKFWAPLQPRQAPRYLNQLDAASPGTLLFLCPGNRLSFLWDEVRVQLESCGHAVTGGRVDDQGMVRRAKADLPDKQVMMTTWSYLLEMFENADPDPAVISDIRQLQGLARRQEDEGFAPLTDEMVKESWEKRDAHFRRMCDDAVFRGRTAGWLNTDSLTLRRSARGYGRYCRVDGSEKVLRLGVEYTAELFERSPLWISSRNSYYEGGDDPGAIFTGTKFDGPRWDRWWKPVTLKRNVVYDEVLADVTAQLQAVAEQVLAMGE